MNQPSSSEVQSDIGPGRSERLVPVPEDDRVTGVSLPLRLYASKHVHRLLPAPVALALAAAVGPAARQRRNPDERRHAEEFMRELLQHTPRAGEAEALAEQWLREKSRLRELFWRPWLLKRSRLHGAEHWDAAHSEGRGCILLLSHFGAVWAVGGVLARHGLKIYAVASPHYWGPMPPGYQGLAILYQRRQYLEKILESRVVPSDARPDRFLELLQAGESIGIAFDVPGFAATPFLGRTLYLGGGPATLALKTKSHLLPVIPERHGSRIDVRLLPPLDPSDYPDPRSLRAAIAKTFEPLIVAHPESVEMAWNPSPLVSGIPPDVSTMQTERSF